MMCVYLAHFIQVVMIQFDKTVKKIRSDNGTAFMNFVCVIFLIVERKHSVTSPI